MFKCTICIFLHFLQVQTMVPGKIAPNIPRGSVIVMDNASYHSVQLDKPPTTSSRVGEIREWLTSQGVYRNFFDIYYILNPVGVEQDGTFS